MFVRSHVYPAGSVKSGAMQIGLVWKSKVHSVYVYPDFKDLWGMQKYGLVWNVIRDALTLLRMECVPMKGSQREYATVNDIVSVCG